MRVNSLIDIPPWNLGRIVVFQLIKRRLLGQFDFFQIKVSNRSVEFLNLILSKSRIENRV